MTCNQPDNDFDSARVLQASLQELLNDSANDSYLKEIHFIVNQFKVVFSFVYLTLSKQRKIYVVVFCIYDHSDMMATLNHICVTSGLL